MPGDSPTLAEINDFIQTASCTMEASNLTSIEIECDGTRILISRDQKHESPTASTPGNPAMEVDPIPVESSQPDLTFPISAPMIGTFYSAAAPGEPPLVQPGERIESGQVIGIIEAMKIMNEIVADRAGILDEVLVANAQTVEYGQPLMRLSPLPPE